MHACVCTYAQTCVWMREGNTRVTGRQKKHTCISQKAILIVLDDPRGRVIEAVSTVVTAFRDFSRRVLIGELRDTLKGYNG